MPRRRRARRLDRRQPAQVAVHADGLLGALDAAARRRFRAAFAAHGDYLAATEGAVDLRDYGPALGRRFRALKLWTVLRCYGREGLQALIREHVRLAALFEEWVRAEPGWEVVGAAALLDRLLPPRELDNDELARRATATGQDLRRDDAGSRGESVIRLAIGNAWTTEEDVRIAWEVLRECAR